MRDNTVFVFLFILSALPVVARTRVIVAEEQWDPEQHMCPGPGHLHLTGVPVPWGVPGRAYLTVPPEVEIVPSKMPNAGFGVISKTFIPKYTWLAEYEGITVLPDEKDYTSAYTWSVDKGFERLRYVDAGKLETSNWMRFINAPRNVFEENVDLRECFDKVFYQTTRDISPGQELLIHYGNQYARYMGILAEYNFSQIVNHVSKHLERKVKNVRRIFKVLNRTMYPEDRCLNSNASTVLAEAKNHLMMIMGQEFYTALKTSEYVAG